MTKASRKARAQNAGSTVEGVFRLITEMEEPLHEAVHLVTVLSFAGSDDIDDQKSIGFVATKAAANLRRVNKALQSLFALVRQG